MAHHPPQAAGCGQTEAQATAQQLVAVMEAMIAKTEKQAALLLEKAGYKTQLHEAMRFGAYALQERAEKYRATLENLKASRSSELAQASLDANMVTATKVAA